MIKKFLLSTDHGAKDADDTQMICDVIAGAWGKKFLMPYPK